MIQTPRLSRLALPLARLAAGLLCCALAGPGSAQSEVPLIRYRDAQWPGGPPIGATAGAAFLDYDGDGWVDFFVNLSGSLWRNEGGVTWTRVADLDVFQPPINSRYGATCGDYDNDGLPDIATEPRQSDTDDCFHLLHNLGGASFLDVAVDPGVVSGQPCEMNAETGCWADVDDDGDLDLWITAYLDETVPDGSGNRFWENLGPIGLNGAYVLELRTEQANLGIPPNVARPEGAQMLDIDRDGDIDGYANGTVYQNVSVTGPLFDRLVRRATGITSAGVLDEGALFADYDLDGDQDLFLLYQGLPNRLWENRGDGSFVQADFIEDPGRGATQGSSAEDWDLDGDIDLSTGNILRRNMLVETGTPLLRIAQHDIPDTDIQFASPAWADWDHDGDPDALIANWFGASFLYRNTTYDLDTTPFERRTIRVRVVNDSPQVPRGLETEYGATVEVRVHGDDSGFVRRRFVASSHGYLQQSEYALTMALPPGSDPVRPALGVFFDLLVDFPSLPSNGLLRIDRSVNRALGGIHLAKLIDREITVYRSGKVVLDGETFLPGGPWSQRLFTTNDGLALPARGAPLPDPAPAPAASWYVGLELDTGAAEAPLLTSELVLDGQLDVPVFCKQEPANVALWDVTVFGDPRLVTTWALESRAENRRHFLPLEVVLQPGRLYRLVCRVSELRASPLPASDPGDPLQVSGGLSFQDIDPCNGKEVNLAPLDPGAAYLALRLRPSQPAAPARRPGGDPLRRSR